jgi:DNA polymerase-3 subunit alpha
MFKMSCGCSFNILNETPLKLEFIPDVNILNLECRATWDLFKSGNTQGVFQLESPSAQNLTKKLAPSNIEELCALNALLRPGPMEGMIEGKSLTNHYIDRKHNLEQVTYLHPALEPILKYTYGILVYQEQATSIVMALAGFDLREADSLRRATGKKKPEEMDAVEKLFVEKASSYGILNIDEAKEIWGWIRSSQRYSFNKSHSLSYAMNGYLSAYAKAHFPRAFFKEYLAMAHDKIKPKEEICALVNNAKNMNIPILPPDIRINNDSFVLKDKTIYFGLTNISGIGENVAKKIIQNIATLTPDINTLSWSEILFHILYTTNSTAARNMLSCGCFDYLHISRNQMLFEYDVIMQLSEREIKYCHTNIDLKMCIKNILEALLQCGAGKNAGISNKNRVAHIKSLIINLNNPSYSLKDSPQWIAGVEQSLLGASLTYHQIDGCDTSATTATCKEVLDGKSGLNLVGVQIESVNEIVTKRGKTPGQKMAFIIASDGTGILNNIIAFPNVWNEVKNIVLPGNTVLIEGKVGKGSFIVNKVFQA